MDDGSGFSLYHKLRVGGGEAETDDEEEDEVMEYDDE
jgi:hypothetical protein